MSNISRSNDGRVTRRGFFKGGTVLRMYPADSTIMNTSSSRDFPDRIALMEQRDDSISCRGGCSFWHDGWLKVEHLVLFVAG